MSTNRDQLQQSLWELHYDLLEPEEAGKLRAAIASDPEVARQWAETLAVASKLAQAAKLEGIGVPQVNLVARAVEAKPGSNGRDTLDDDPILAQLVAAADTVSIDRATSDSQRSAVTSVRSPRRWWLASTTVAATAAAIGMLILGSAYYSRVRRGPMAAVRVEAEPVAAAEAGTERAFRLVTTRLDSSSVASESFPATPATLSFSVVARGAMLLAGTAATGDDGAASITLPPQLVIPRDAELRVTAQAADSRLSQSTITVPLEPTRCLTYLIVDRPVYRPGETVFFRSLTLQRRSLVPNSDVPIRYELIDPSGAIVPGAFTEGVTDEGVGNGSFVIPSTAPGGPYTLVAKSLDGFFPEERCEFQVRAYRVPRFKKELEFRRRSYGPGETVEADFTALRAEGGPLAGANVRVMATVDDEVVYRGSAVTGPAGDCFVSFRLPELISRGRGQLSVSIDDGGTRETQSKTIPIHLGVVSVDFYPEGGYLVDALENRVYFSARDALDNPIHLAGEILDRSGQVVAEVETKRDGMGRFRLVPRQGERYTLKVTTPVDVTSRPKLPTVVKDLPVIDSGSGVFDPQQPITMVVRSNKPAAVLVRAVCRGTLVGHREVQLHAGDNSISLPLSDAAGGVVRLTLLDPTERPALPLVERLVFRRTDKRLQVEIVEQDSALQRSPGQPVRLTLQVRDESGEPAAALLGVSVVDDAALSLQPTERPDLRTHFLLTSEIEKPEDLEHANFYLSDDPEAAESLDLLLGTQGWRRFVSGSTAQASVDFREQLVRLLQLDGEPSSVQASPSSYSNADLLVQRWRLYRATVQAAWQELLRQARVLMLVVLFLWLLTILVHLRRNASLNAALWLLVAPTSLWLFGCGVQEAMVVETTDSAQVDSFAADARQDEAEIMMAEESAVAPVQSATPAPVPLAEENLGGSPPAEASWMPQARIAEVDAVDRQTLVQLPPHTPRTLSPQQLQRLLATRGLDADRVADALLDQLRFPVRQYAHRRATVDTEVRDDFTETLYWQPMLMTDSRGRATIRFDLSDSVTTFRLSVDGHATDGRIGSGGGAVTSRLPFQIEPKMPLEVTVGDRIDLPIAVINASDEDLDVQLSMTTDRVFQAAGDTAARLELAPGQGERQHVSLDVLGGQGQQDASITIRGIAQTPSTGSLADSIVRRVHVTPAGYPARRSIAGRLSGQAEVRLPIPRDMVPGSLAVTVRAFPSPIADVMSGVESILREPHGCFEQTSATNYPNTMALLYLQETQTDNPRVERRALEMLDRGYQKLISFECQQRGYEWFGDDPGHEALSALGLMQFTDMSRVMDVSQEMIARTRNWLLGRRDGGGGFHRNPRHLHAWSVDQQIVNAYVLWAISEADVSAGQPTRAVGQLAAELDRMASVARESRDPYLVALSAAALMNVKRADEGEALLERLAELQHEDGSLQGKTTVTSSGGLSLKMETTALATIAWVKSPRFIPQARLAAQWIAGNRLGSGGFGSTQATVLALKALVAVADDGASRAGGTLEIRVRGQLIGSVKLPSEPRSGSAVEIAGLGTRLEAAHRDVGEVDVELLASGSGNLSYTIDVASHVLQPASSEECPLRLATKISAQADDGSVSAGDLLKVETRVENATGRGLPMTVAIVGLPGGVQPRVEELDELRRAGRFDFYEIRGREIVFYWRTLEPEAVQRIEFHVTAAVPGKYTGSASRTYLYYTAEQKHWTEPLAIEIMP